VDEKPVVKGKASAKSKKEDADDDDAEEVSDDWEKPEEEDDWDPDFDEFDVPKSTAKKAGKKDAEEEDFAIDDEFKDMGLFDDSGGFDDDDDDF
jgi:DNA-directed RNA polymerase subunit delta